MPAPTDEQIFNYNLPTEPECGRCQSDELRFIEYSDYIVYECKSCGLSQHQKMSNKMNNANATAYPVENCIIDNSGEYLGLTKREHFAGLAMQGWLAADFSAQMLSTEIAAASVELADALLAELDK